MSPQQTPRRAASPLLGGGLAGDWDELVGRLDALALNSVAPAVDNPFRNGVAGSRSFLQEQQATGNELGRLNAVAQDSLAKLRAQVAEQQQANQLLELEDTLLQHNALSAQQQQMSPKVPVIVSPRLLPASQFSPVRPISPFMQEPVMVVGQASPAILPAQSPMLMPTAVNTLVSTPLLANPESPRILAVGGYGQMQAMDVNAMGSPVWAPRSHVMSPLMVPTNGDIALSPQIQPRSCHFKTPDCLQSCIAHQF